MSTTPVTELPGVAQARERIREEFDIDPEVWLLSQAPDGTTKQLTAVARRLGVAAPLLSMWWDAASEGTTLRERQRLARDAIKREEEAHAARVAARRAANRDRLARDRRTYYSNRSGTPVDLVEVPEQGRLALLPVDTYRAILDLRTNEQTTTPQIIARLGVSDPIVRAVLGPLSTTAVRGIDELEAIARFREENDRWPRNGNDANETLLARRLKLMRRGGGPQVLRYVADHLLPGWDYPVPVRSRSTPAWAAPMVDRVVAFRAANPDLWPTREDAPQEWADVVDLRAAARHDARLVDVLDRRLPGWRYPAMTTAIRKS